jgi:pimeloyl-ACP methyl ester carboxylesterase
MLNNTKHMKRIYSIPAIGLMVLLILVSKLSNAQTYFTAEVKGKGKPMILIHGLYCSGEVWKETVDRYQKDYECHVLTLAGFGGNQAKLNDHFLESVKDDLIAYTKSKKLKSPVIMGHSMGAFLSLWAASSAPGLFEKVIAVDGAPFLPALIMPNATVESSKAMAEQAKNGMANQTPEQIKQSQIAMLSSMITRPDDITTVTTIAEKADSKTQGQVFYEMFTTDLRPAMASVECPVLVLGAWIAYKNYGTTHDSVFKNYTDQMASAKNVKVEITDTAKHFIFYDEPAWFYDKVDTFLK